MPIEKEIATCSTLADNVGKLVKFFALLSTFLGAYYFIAYTVKLGIPFPLELSVLPTALLAIGVVSVFLAVIIILYLFLASLVHADPFGIDYPELINTNTKGIICATPLVQFWNWLLIYGAPIGIWLILILYNYLPNVELFFFTYGAWAIIYGIAKVQSKRRIALKNFSKIDYFNALKIAATTFLVSFFGLLSSIVFITLLASRGLLNEPQQIIIALSFFFIMNFGALTSHLSPNTIQIENNETVRSYKELKKDLYVSPVRTIAAISLLLTMVPNVAPYMGELPLKLLNIGGGIERVFYDRKEIIDRLPTSLVQKCPDKKVVCRTNRLKIILDLGQFIYVQNSSSKDEKIYRIERMGLIDEISRDKQMPPPNRDKVPHH